MFNRLIWALFAAAMPLLGGQVYAQQQEVTKLRIHYPQLPPYIYLNGESDQVSGIFYQRHALSIAPKAVVALRLWVRLRHSAAPDGALRRPRRP